MSWFINLNLRNLRLFEMFCRTWSLHYLMWKKLDSKYSTLLYSLQNNYENLTGWCLRWASNIRCNALVGKHKQSTLACVEDIDVCLFICNLVSAVKRFVGFLWSLNRRFCLGRLNEFLTMTSTFIDSFDSHIHSLKDMSV